MHVPFFLPLQTLAVLLIKRVFCDRNETSAISVLIDCLNRIPASRAADTSARHGCYFFYITPSLWSNPWTIYNQQSLILIIGQLFTDIDCACATSAKSNGASSRGAWMNQRDTLHLHILYGVYNSCYNFIISLWAEPHATVHDSKFSLIVFL